MKKKIPTFTTDQEAEDFINSADLSDYDLSGARLVRFEFKPKDHRITMRLPESLYKTLRTKADGSGIPYQRFIRQAIETALFGTQPTGIK